MFFCWPSFELKQVSPYNDTNMRFLSLWCALLCGIPEAYAVKLTPVCKTLPEITDIVIHPEVPSSGYFVTHKTGELGFCSTPKNEKSARFNLIHKFDVVTPSEMGLLSIAFDREFKSNQKFFIHRNIQKNGKRISELSEWKFTTGRGAPSYQREIFTVEQPYSNHNGGKILVSSKGTLFLALGDGGSANDPHNYSQNSNSFLGKILELDPKQPDPIPKIFASGLRNPWKITFENPNTLVVADVGQNAFEEISRASRGDNLGWNVKEGDSCFRSNKKCGDPSLRDPIFVYDHSRGQSITGGEISGPNSYRSLSGNYFFGDFESGRIWAMNLNDPKATKEILDTDLAISTFGLNADSMILVGSFYSGEIFLLQE